LRCGFSGTYLPAGDYAFLLWNFFAALILDVSWKYYFHYPPSSYVILDEMDEDDEAAPKETFELIFRLLQYCKREWIWHISGFSWLFIYSITRIFVPYYTGQVIATVVATKSYPSLATAVYVMAFISFVSAMAAGLRGGSFEYAYARINRSIRHDLFTGLILSERTQNAVAESNDVAEEVLSTMRTVRSFACENVEGDRFYLKLTKTLNVTKTKAIAYIGFLWVSELFQTFIIVAVLWYGGHLVLTSKMKVFEYIDRVPTILHYGTSQPSTLKGRIEFRNVHFSYPTRNNLPILRDLSFIVEPGETVALVGPSGSGKSSCIALLENFYQPNAGQVLVDGVPLEDYEHHYIHRKKKPPNQIALVGQEPVLFARSVTENIRYGVDVMEADVVKAAEMANAHGFIMQTTHKYETNVGEKGSQMSGGQKQRIAIARALVREPAILLLDEATSALDTESEHLVQEAIYKNLDGKSVILIAHRLSTVEKADKIIVINKGKVEQVGTHEELLKQPGTYATLVARQMMGDQRPHAPQLMAPSPSR
ncbi:ABC transporter, ATP-binding protein, partial [Ancylostoma duodenale]